MGWFLWCSLLTSFTSVQTNCINEFLSNLGSSEKIDHDLFGNMSKLPVESTHSNPDPLWQLLPHASAFLFICRQAWNVVLVHKCLLSNQVLDWILSWAIFLIHNLIKWIFTQTFFNLIGHSCWECSKHLIIQRFVNSPF